MNFQQYLQAQGMSNNYPHQTLQPAPYLRRTAAQTSPFVSYAPQQHQGIMANTGAQPTFFADEIYHHRDEQALLEEMMHQPVAQPPVTNFGFRPLLPLSPGPMPTNAAPSASIWKTESIAPLVAPGVLGSHVDNAQYAPVFDHDWHRASIDYDASSHGSVDTQATSPLTPATDGSGSFAEHFFRTTQCGANTVADSFATKQNALGLFDARVLHPAAMPTTFAVPRASSYNTSAAFEVPLAQTAHHSSAGPAAFDIQTSSANPAYANHHHHVLPFRPTPIFKRDSFSDELHSLGRTSESDDDNPTPRTPETDEHSSVSSRRSSDSSAVDEVRQQRDPDAYLLSMRRRGISYKDIRRRGGFKEAESTLRGRWRVLTKGKHERVRKPEWTANDDALLLEAVAESMRNPRGGAAPKVAGRKVPWKVVSRRIKENGGTYLFAPATCAKRWDALMDL
ncbi:hypothetical protein LTR85_002777 [Meristemomyces frigidus]|nr:hypothetical protein LTR85_002777 [Meristemomyces frigidus]